MIKDRLLQAVLAIGIYFGAFKAAMQILPEKAIAVPAAVVAAFGLHYLLVRLAMDGRDKENFNPAFEAAILAVCVTVASLWL